MKEIDWSNAPEDATHYNEVNNMFYKLDIELRYNYWSAYRKEWVQAGFPCEYVSNFHERVITTQWNGKGLPTVGTVCNILTFDSRDIPVEVLSVGDTRVFVRNVNTGEELAPYLEGVTFSVIKTQEQIAAEEREKALDKMYGIITSIERKDNKNDMVEALYDKGYRLTKTEEQ